MKKLMYICSLSCMFLLTSLSVSAQQYVSRAEAISIVQTQFNQANSSTKVQTAYLVDFYDSSVQSTVPNVVTKDRQAEAHFYNELLDNLKSKSVADAIKDTYDDIVAKGHPAKAPLWQTIRDKAILLLTN